MRIASVRINNYRCLEDVSLDFDAVTVFVGANGTGKSSVLHALDWFFSGGSLSVDDCGGRDPTVAISVEVVFTNLSQADEDAFGSYVINNSVRLWRTWSDADDDRLTGRGLGIPIVRNRQI